MKNWLSIMKLLQASINCFPKWTQVDYGKYSVSSDFVTKTVPGIKKKYTYYLIHNILLSGIKIEMKGLHFVDSTTL